MSREELILRPDGVRRDGGAVELELRMPWYRSLPLSSIVDVRITVNGTPVDRDALRLELDGRPYVFADLEPAFETVWFIQDPMTVTTPDLGLGSGDPVEVTAGLGLRIPYIIIEPVGALQRYNEMTRKVVLA